MIELRNLCKSFSVRGQRKVVADNINMVIPGGVSVALLGRNGAGKSTLLQMISGVTAPDSGDIITSGSISWPVGFGGSFHRELTGCQNVKFIARVYGVDTRELSDFVEDFAQLGRHYHMPVRTYSSGMRSRLAFGASMGVKFDTYLVDEVTAVGDANFKTRSRILFNQRMRDSGALLVSHSLRKIRRLCNAAAILESGKLTYFEDLDEAIELHRKSIGGDALDDD